MEGKRRKLRVAIIGGGLGGLALANFFASHGDLIDCSIFERDATEGGYRPQGFRIGLDTGGITALEACGLSHATLQTAGLDAEALSAIKVGDALTLETYLQFPASGNGIVSRWRLHELLQRAVAPALHFSKAFTHFACSRDCVTAFFADGTSFDADILVGADGVNSRVRRQWLPQLQLLDSGVTGLAGDVPLEHLESRKSALADLLRMAHGSLVRLIGPEGHSWLLLSYREEETGKGKLIWVLNHHPRTPQEDYAMDAGAESWLAYATQQAARAHPELRTLVELTRPEWLLPPKHQFYLPAAAVQQNPYHSAAMQYATSLEGDNGRDNNGRGVYAPIALLGDAAHAMTTHRGQGANTAFADAADLGPVVLGIAQEFVGSQRVDAAQLRGYHATCSRRGAERISGSLSSTNAMHTRSKLFLWIQRVMMRIMNVIIMIVLFIRGLFF